MTNELDVDGIGTVGFPEHFMARRMKDTDTQVKDEVVEMIAYYDVKSMAGTTAPLKLMATPWWLMARSWHCPTHAPLLRSSRSTLLSTSASPPGCS